MSSTKKVAFLVAMEGIERVELEQPWDAVKDGGHEAVLISTDEGEVQTFDHLTESSTQKVDQTVAGLSVDDFDALVLPGGVANPDALRMNADAVSFVGEFVRSGKPVAAICHAPWTLVEADVLKDRTITSWPSLQPDIRNAGGTWVDQEVCRDGNLVSSRNPDDLPAFTDAMVELFT